MLKATCPPYGAVQLQVDVLQLEWRYSAKLERCLSCCRTQILKHVFLLICMSVFDTFVIVIGNMQNDFLTPILSKTLHKKPGANTEILLCWIHTYLA